MRVESPWGSAETAKVVHVVGGVTDEVFSFLRPAISTLAHSGLRQTVVMIDDARYGHHMTNLCASAELVLTPTIRSPVNQWRALFQACLGSLASGPVHAVHLHGFLPCLLGAAAVRAARLRAPVFYSPHGSRSLGSLRSIGSPALCLVRPLLRPLPSAAIVTVPREARAFARWASVAVVESPVSDVFLSTPRSEALHPLILTGGWVHNARCVEVFAQLAVLMSVEDLHISFNWIGTVDSASRQRLTAAHVSVLEAASDVECASRLAAGWVFVAPGGTRGFPVILAKAMAAGLPCVAADCPQFREVIRDGATGFLCRSEHEMIRRIATLIDTPELRARMGQAAHDDAKRRFCETRFSASLLEAYAMNTHAIETKGHAGGNEMTPSLRSDLYCVRQALREASAARGGRGPNGDAHCAIALTRSHSRSE